jgi:oxygen-dependent protoporphyrinogen oxidase
VATLFRKKTHKDEQVVAPPANKKARGRVLFSFDRGCQVLPDTLAATLGPAVRLSTAVSGIAKSACGWNINAVTGGREETSDHAAVLLTAPAWELGGFQIGAPGSFSFALLKEIVYPPVARVTLGFREDQFPAPIHGFGFLVPGKERLHILGTLFASCIYPGRAPQGHVNLSSYLGGLRNPGIASLSPAKTVEAALGDYRTLLGVTGEPVFASHALIPSAIPQYTIGYGRFGQWMTDTEQSMPGLFFAGNYRSGISVADTIGSALSAAKRVAAFLNA